MAQTKLPVGKSVRVSMLVAGLALCFLAYIYRAQFRALVLPGVFTVSGRVHQYGEVVEARLASDFERAELPYPPAKMILVALKREMKIEVWAAAAEGRFKLVRTYPILAASGTLGPKLREGDRQVPEGVYRVESLNPNSAFHLALRLNYPNAFDRAKAQLDGRSDLGSDIMIHGPSSSIGCLAVTEEAAEDLFVLAAETRPRNIAVIISPLDLRSLDVPNDVPNLPDWTSDLYNTIRAALKELDRGFESTE